MYFLQAGLRPNLHLEADEGRNERRQAFSPSGFPIRECFYENGEDGLDDPADEAFRITPVVVDNKESMTEIDGKIVA